MSEFDDFNASGWDDASAVLGTKTCTIAGNNYPGVLDQFGAVRTMDMGGFAGEYDATVLLKLAHVAAHAGTRPEKYFEGKQLLVSGRTYKIERAEVDELTVTLALVNPNRVKS